MADKQKNPCCLCCGKGDEENMYTGAWDVTPVVTVCSTFGGTTIDFRDAVWGDVKECKVNARCVLGTVTVIVPDDKIKVDTTCAGCMSGCVWCGGYMGPNDAELEIKLCQYAWLGRVYVKKASSIKDAKSDKYLAEQEAKAANAGAAVDSQPSKGD